MKYKALTLYSDDEAQAILENGSREQLLEFALSVGEYGSNRQKAQELCLNLLENTDAEIRANAIKGLSYIARNHRFLDKRRVKPYLLRELRENTEFREDIANSIEDIRSFLDWNVGYKELKRTIDTE